MKNKIYLRVVRIKNRWGFQEIFSLIEDIEEDMKVVRNGVEARYFELKEIN